MKKMIPLLSLTILLLVLAACSSTSQANTGSVSVQPNQTVQPADAKKDATTTAQQPAASEDQTREDSQGAVEVSIKPINLITTGDSLEFEVSMNTHSVDLSMDLARLSTLATDTGLSVQGIKWDAPTGGHHVGGKLSFPAAVNGKPILEGAKKLTLTIINVDASQRVFTWDLP